MQKGEKKDQPVLDKAQAEFFLSRLMCVNDISVKATIVTQLFIGARTSELRALTWDDVNLDAGVIDINKSADKKGRVNKPKTKAGLRIIRIDAALIGFLLQYKRLQNEQIESLGSLWKDNNLCFPNTTGGFMPQGTTNRAVLQIVTGTDLPQDLHPHSLRHSFASLLIDGGADVKAVQGLLGHASATMTLDVYSHSLASVHGKNMIHMRRMIRFFGVSTKNNSDHSLFRRGV